MSNFTSIIIECERAQGAGTKETIKAALVKADEIAKKLIRYALDPYLVFGVRKYDEPTPSAVDSPDAYTNYFTVLDMLAARKITGDAARDAVTSALSLFSAENIPYVSRIIDKDLKAGFSAETVNKIYKNLVPTFEVMLADKCETPEEFLEKIKYPCLAQHKYDGNRTIAIVRKDSVEYRARSGKLSEHLNGLFDLDLHKIWDVLKYDYVLDGEAFASDFTETMNAKKEGNDKAKDALRLRAFFLMPLTDWLAQSTKITMEHNQQFIQNLLTTVESVKVLPCDGREVADYQDMVNYCNEVIDTHGEEGLILKNYDSVYQWQRTIDWCKLKRFYDVDARIVSWYPGRPKSRLEHTCGGIVVEGHDEKNQPFRSNVGSGFSDEVRDDIAKNFDSKYLNKTAVVTYQEITKSKGSDIFSLRFPTFNHVRDDKTVDPI
jgi:DNA ligase-1